MKAKRILSTILSAAMLLCLAACGESDSPESTKSSKKTEVTTSVNTPESTPDSSEDAGYKLPAGAESPYELYKTVLAYLNNGFHFDDLKNVYDLNLTLVYSFKQEENPDNNFISGMKYDEACAMIAKLTEIAKANMPVDADGDFEDDLIDYYQFKEALPGQLQSKANENRDVFEQFIENICVVLYTSDRDDGRNPFRTDQIVWEVKNENEIEIEKYRHYDGYEDLYANFPQIYEIDLGKYQSDNDVYGMGMLYAKIGSSYYFLSFSEVW